AQPVPELQWARAVIVRQIEHLARLVEDLLEVTRITRGRIRLRMERIDLVCLVRTIAEDYRATLERAGLELVVQVPPTTVWVQGDATRLTQVLGNLLDNARKFTSPGGHVTVLLVSDGAGRQAVVTVRDDGVGIALELLPRLFDAFSQADQSLHRTQGGL